MDIDPDKWFQDKISQDLMQWHRIEGVLHRQQTRFQRLEIIATGSYGKCLVLDDKIQSSEADEFIYHEALVQPPLLAHPRPERVFIAGGGEGATLREVLRHRTVEKAVMIDIDEEVIAACQQFLPEHSQGAFKDERTELRHVDARDYLANCGQAFDVIIIDLPEPIEEGPAYRLYTREFYHLVRQRLTRHGIISVQSGSASLNELLCFGAVYHTLRSVFPIVRPYQTDVPSFGGPWGFCLASSSLDAATLTPAEIDSRIAARQLSGLRFYDGTSHQGMFAVPRYIREWFAQPPRLITDDEPLYVYQEE